MIKRKTKFYSFYVQIESSYRVRVYAFNVCLCYGLAQGVNYLLVLYLYAFGYVLFN